MTFTCDFKSTPQQLADRYEWRVFLVDKGKVKVNRDTVQNLDGGFKLDQNGKTLQIIDVTPEEFNNSLLRCIAFQDRTPFPSINGSLLFILPLLKPHLLPTIESYPTPCDIFVKFGEEKYWQWSCTAVIIGGAVGGLVILVEASALIGCYIVKNKRKRKKTMPKTV